MSLISLLDNCNRQQVHHDSFACNQHPFSLKATTEGGIRTVELSSLSNVHLMLHYMNISVLIIV